MDADDPCAIYERHLAAVSPAAIAGDFEVILANIAIPSQFLTADREVVVSSPEELALVLEDYAEMLRAEGVTDERERMLEAAFIPGMPDMIAGRHETEWHFADGRPPHRFATRLLLMRYPGGWKLIWLQTSLACDEIAVLSPEFAAAQLRVLHHISKGRH